MKEDYVELMQRWYAAVEGNDDNWEKAVMADPQNGIVYSRLENFSYKTVKSLLALAKHDQNSETLRMVKKAIDAALNGKN